MVSFRAAMLGIISIGFAVLTACSTGPAMADPPVARPITAGVSAGYRLGTGDEVKITVFDEKDLSGAFTIDGLGVISMALIGQIELKGLTIDQAQNLIEAKLMDGCQNGGTSCYLRDPQVQVEMTKGRPYYILGEVNRAGEYAFTSGLTVLNAIAAAGDFTYRADKKKIMITNADGVEREVVLTSTTPVNPGDRIRIKERFF